MTRLDGWRNEGMNRDGRSELSYCISATDFKERTSARRYCDEVRVYQEEKQPGNLFLPFLNPITVYCTHKCFLVKLV